MVSKENKKPPGLQRTTSMTAQESASPHIGLTPARQKAEVMVMAIPTEVPCPPCQYLHAGDLLLPRNAGTKASFCSPRKGGTLGYPWQTHAGDAAFHQAAADAQLTCRATELELFSLQQAPQKGPHKSFAALMLLQSCLPDPFTHRFGNCLSSAAITET